MEKPEMKMKSIFYAFGIRCAQIVIFRKRDERRH
jgi:hypothetical protein